MRTAFISGHLSLTKEEFDTHYKDLIDAAYWLGHSFVIGDAGGADAMAQEYLALHWKIAKSRVTVYHAYMTPRNNYFGFPAIANHPSQTAKDRAMTLASDYDIAWVREGRENSGTARNIKRRKSSSEKKDESGSNG